MDSLTAGFDADTARMQKASSELQAAHLTLVPQSSSSALAIQMGLRGAIPTGTEHTYPLTITIPAQSDAFDSAIAMASCEKVFKRLRTGWVESSSNGMLQAYAGVTLSTPEAYQQLISSLPAVTATQSSVPLAQLTFGNAVIVAPTAGFALADGDRGRLTPLSPQELLGVGVVLDVASDTRTALVRGYDTREHDDQTNGIRDRFNRRTTSLEMRQWALDAGWQETSSGATSHDYRRDNLIARLPHGLSTFLQLDADSGKLTEVLRPFDLYAKAQAKARAKPEETAEELATRLVEEGHVTTKTELFAARGRAVQVNRNQPTLAVITQFADSIKSAVLNTDGGMPLAFATQTDGVVEGIISVAPSGSVRRWNERNGTGLLIAAAQLVRTREGKNGPSVEYDHSVPPSIVSGTLEALQGPGMLPPVEHVATEPVLTPEGRIARHPGYNRAAKAVITMPHRDRSRWLRDYVVPDNPSKQDAQAAYDFLRTELLESFPFATPVDQARAFAYLLTCVGRPLLNGSIGFLATAPDRGSGKSYLLMIGRLLAQGHVHATSYKVGGWADDETQKALVSLILSGGRFFHCDEVPRGAEVKGTTLTGALSAVDGEVKHRILQGNDMATLKNVIITAAGNQVELGGDTNRRFLTIRIQRPPAGTASDQTVYRHPNLYAYVLKNRPQLLAAAHTVLLHGLQNKATQRVIPGMKFSHNWAGQILGAMSHLTHSNGRELAEFALTGWDAEVAEQDDLGTEWGELLAAIWKHSSGHPRPAAELFKISKIGAEDERPLLPSELAFTGGTETQIAVKWGNELRKILNTSVPFEGVTYRMTVPNRAEKSKKSKQYVVEAFDASGRALIPGRPIAPPEPNATVAPPETHEVS
ncbi:hypothetical protein [Glaciibacter psychrotolerans]|uniref:Uncharacterized protein n=1 Tax=Glaciibacter psychrotolerans TaxID=670054 RepID=A0A7Z0J5Y0_9MICO|nr:hypothetical protein [Leifsonia psychrotolerans]NYJ19611.1 hypothetical protein [Leifsonia psychrotolerans]